MHRGQDCSLAPRGGYAAGRREPTASLNPNLNPYPTPHPNPNLNPNPNPNPNPDSNPNQGSPWWDCDLAKASSGYACTLYRALDDMMLCFCTDAPSCDGLNTSSAYDGTCALGDGTCSKDDAAWCRDDFCQ